MRENQDADIIVIGAGIAGASAAAALARSASVIMLEMESQPGYHSTGRSAAYFAPAYGNAVVRAFTRASEAFYMQPPAGFAEVPLVRPRSAMFIATEEQRPALAAMHNEVAGLQNLDTAAACARVPILSPDYLSAALEDCSGGDMDVDAILQGYLRSFRRRGGVLQKQHRASQLRFAGGVWQVDTEDRVLRAPTVVNAAGAWADGVALSAGLGALGMTPMRRTALLVAAPAEVSIEDWPLVVDADESFYFKPDAGQLLLSPADETPTSPGDAQPEELDVAIAVDRFMRATNMDVRRVSHSWAGLRTFSPDRTFVVGYDPRAQGFFWLAGQGGYGVQSAPGIAELAQYLITGDTPDTGTAGITNYADAVAPDRLIVGGC